jgi:hypothetical protein
VAACVRSAQSNLTALDGLSTRQRNLLEGEHKQLPQEIEAKVLELLVELLISVLPVNKEGEGDEQDHR